METEISQELINAYRGTTYRAFQPAIDIRIGELSAALDKLLIEHKVFTWAFLTACNPFSQVLSEEENEKRHEHLKSLLQGYTLFEGEGVGEDKNWQPEKSVLVLGLTKEQAIEIGRVFQQNAIVFGYSSSPAELLLATGAISPCP